MKCKNCEFFKSGTCTTDLFSLAYSMNDTVAVSSEHPACDIGERLIELRLEIKKKEIRRWFKILWDELVVK